jgi:hypothetical protein
LTLEKHRNERAHELLERLRRIELDVAARIHDRDRRMRDALAERYETTPDPLRKRLAFLLAETRKRLRAVETRLVLAKRVGTT